MLSSLFRFPLERVVSVLAFLIPTNSLAWGQDVEEVANALVFKKGTGDALTVHPDGQTKVKGHQLLGRNGKELARLGKGSCETVACYSFSRDGRLLAVGIRYDSVAKSPDDGTIRGYLRVYDATTGALLKDSGPPVIGPVEHVAFSESGGFLLYQTGKYEERGGR